MGVLSGIRVIDLADNLAGPGAAMHLGDQGAEVIKVEVPGGGVSRLTNRVASNVGFSPNFVALNRNKRSMCLNLKLETCRQIFYRLVKKSDVLIVSMVPRVAEHLGVSYETIQGINPRLVYAHVTAYGTKGRFANEPGYDTTALARSGTFAVRRMADGKPVFPPVFIGDFSASMMLSYGICLALMERERSGMGQKVEAPLQSLCLFVQSPQLLRMGATSQAMSSASAEINVYRCQDGKWLFVAAVNDGQWSRLCKVTGLEYLANDPSMDKHAKRIAQSTTLYQIFEGIFGTQSRDHWLKELTAGGVPSAPINESSQEVWEDDHVKETGALIQMKHPVLGNLGLIGIPLSLSRTPGDIRRLPPGAGEHTDEVLQELGYTTDDVRRFRETGVIV